MSTCFSNSPVTRSKQGLSARNVNPPPRPGTCKSRHPGPVIAGRNGVRQIACDRSQKGPGLGLHKGASFPTCEIELAEIDRIILFTDGVLEAENQSGEPFFENRLMEIINRESGAPLESLLNDILESVLAFSDRKQFDDDVCLLGVDVTRTR